MATLPICTIDETGIHQPDYETVRAYFVDEFKRIYGADVYLEPDSQDGAWIAILSLAQHDHNSLAVAVYNSRGPATAQGVGLSSIVKINGMTRKTPSYSTVDLLVVGQVGSVITNGIASGASGEQWLLPETVIIPLSGEITVTARAAEIGAVTAGADTITRINTPTRGWQTVTNPAAAVAGEPVEGDAALRRRQSVSAALPSRTVYEGLIAGVLALPSVVRVAAYENDSDVTDADGIPAHSLSLVVDGGDAAAIASIIAFKKSPGVGLHGTTTVTVMDAFGIPRAVKFYRPTLATIKYAVTVKALSGYTVVVENAIKAALVAWTLARPIGQDIVGTRVYTPAGLNGTPAGDTYEIEALTIAKNAGAPVNAATSDIVLAFNEAATASLVDVTVTVAP